MESLTIGKVARCAEVGIETIRFYEREGLIDEPPRRESGYRQYPEETISRILFIRRAKTLGFTLREIKELLELQIDSSSALTCDDVRRLAEEKIADIREKIGTLQRMEASLVRLVDSCRRRVIANSCPILDVLQKEEPDGTKEIESNPSNE
ncbi:MAG: MerR family transcriptional regulator [Syntrophobacteraceae bacterium]